MKRQRDWGHWALMLFGPLAVCTAAAMIGSLNCATIMKPCPECNTPGNPADYPPLTDDNVIDINARRADAGR